MLHYDFYRRWYSPSNVTIAEVVLHNYDLNFLGRTFQALFFQNCNSYRKNTCNDFYRDCHSPPNGNLANVILRNLDLNFQGQTFQTVRAGVKTSAVTFTEVVFCPLVIEWHRCKCCTRWPWPKLSRSNVWNFTISKTARELAQKCVQ